MRKHSDDIRNVIKVSHYKNDHAQPTDFYFEVDTYIKRLFIGVAWHILSSYRV